MDLSKLSLFRDMGRKLDWLGQRQSVLSVNIANADTPGYRPQDLEALSFRDTLSARAAEMKRNHRHHLTAAGTPGEHRPREAGAPFEASPAGNAVVLEEQMGQVTETAMQHMTVTNLYARSLGLMRIALGRGGQ